jgi:hypothetical protein
VALKTINPTKPTGVIALTMGKMVLVLFRGNERTKNSSKIILLYSMK